MIQLNTYLDVADNTGAKQMMCIHVHKGSTAGWGKKTLKAAGLGDVITCAVKKALPSGEVQQAAMVKAVVVRCKQATRRSDGSYVKFEQTPHDYRRREESEGDSHFWSGGEGTSGEEFYEDHFVGE